MPKALPPSPIAPVNVTALAAVSVGVAPDIVVAASKVIAPVLVASPKVILPPIDVALKQF